MMFARVTHAGQADWEWQSSSSPAWSEQSKTPGEVLAWLQSLTTP
jgi:hypothetical protein